jgi:hypothetical protein
MCYCANRSLDAPARIARLRVERLARAPDVRSRMFWFRIEPRLADQLEQELQLYAVRPSKAELVIQLLREGLVFRHMHRPSPRPRRRRLPLPAELVARLEEP